MVISGTVHCPSINVFRDCFTHKKCPNCCLISLSNLNHFSHIYTSSDAHFQSEHTSNLFRASLGRSSGLLSHFNLLQDCFKSVLQMKGALYKKKTDPMSETGL